MATETVLERQQRPQVIACGRCDRTIITFTLEERRRDPEAWARKVHNAVDAHDAKYHGKPRRPTA